jgi:prepilin-type N-terminal cleavage/methylation domain-containing protein
MPFNFGSSRSPRAGLAPQVGLTLMVRLRLAQPANNAQQGLTLIECIVAIIIVALTVTAITPPILLATATRIQSRRAEQANAIAQAEIDRVRSVIERGNYQEGALPNSNPSGGAPGSAVSNYFMSAAQCSGTQAYPVYIAPNAATVPPNPVSSTALVQVDTSGDCVPDFVMQTYRRNDCYNTTPPPANTPPDGFWLGVRVYQYTPGETLPTMGQDRASLAMTQGQRRDQVNNTRLPMAALYSYVARNDSVRSANCMVAPP